MDIGGPQSASCGRSTRPQRTSDAARALGVRGEVAAADLVADDGFAIVARNWRCRAGEIDIIARKGTLVIFCEVKTRSGDGWGTPASAVTATKVRRMRNLARHWLLESGIHADVIRFDVISVLAHPDGSLSSEWLTGVC